MKKGIDYVGIYVCGLCHDGQGNILYRKRGVRASDEQGKWEPGAGGGLEVGETLEECLRREIKEETTADVVESEFIGMHESFRRLNAEDAHWLGFYYKCLVDPKQVIIPEGEETEAILWQSYHDRPEPMMTGQDEEYEKFKSHFL